MTYLEAKQFLEDVSGDGYMPEERLALYFEALQVVVEEDHEPSDMMELGGLYYEQREFDRALYYYEMAAEMDYDPAYEGLGYIWYYGRTGKKDYEKAFGYFSKLMEKGNVVAAYKVADMYKNGYFVEKDQRKYEEIITELYHESQGWVLEDWQDSYAALPEINMRMAKILVAQGQTEEAIRLYRQAKKILARRITLNAFFGNLNMMKWLIDDLYALTPFDEDFFDLYDLYYWLKKPCRVQFSYDDEEYVVEAFQNGESCEVRFCGETFDGREEFFKNAMLEDVPLTSIFDALYDFKVLS